MLTNPVPPPSAAGAPGAETGPPARRAAHTDNPAPAAQLDGRARPYRADRCQSAGHPLPMGAGHPARMAEIAAALEVVPRSATSVVDDLEEAGSSIKSGRPA